MSSPAIIGWSHGKFGRSESPLPQMMADVARDAIAEAGLEPADIDVIHVGVFNNGLSRQGFEAALPGTAFPNSPAHPLTGTRTPALPAPPQSSQPTTPSPPAATRPPWSSVPNA